MASSRFRVAVNRGTNIKVAKYTTPWDENQPIVKDAAAIHKAWVAYAKQVRGEDFESSEPQPGKCSGADWNEIDEGLDVSAGIGDLDNNEGRDTEDVQTFKAYFEGKEDVAVGILILQAAEQGIYEENEEHDNDTLGIRWLVGHPGARGAGFALMAKADEVHSQNRYKKKPMCVTSAASAVAWYKSKGFEDIGASKCNEQGPCGCRLMKKPAPDLTNDITG